jgi:hypothetical protein
MSAYKLEFSRVLQGLFDIDVDPAHNMCLKTRQAEQISHVQCCAKWVAFKRVFGQCLRPKGVQNEFVAESHAVDSICVEDGALVGHGPATDNLQRRVQ